MPSNRQSTSGWVFLLFLVLAWLWWRSQQPNTDEMMSYYHDHMSPLGLSEENAKKLVAITVAYPHPEETFEKVIDFFLNMAEATYRLKN
jgi:hypothetical protein